MLTQTEKEKLLAEHLNDYINERHTQEECCGFSDGFMKALDIINSNSPSGVPNDDLIEESQEYLTFYKDYKKQLNNLGFWEFRKRKYLKSMATSALEMHMKTKK